MSHSPLACAQSAEFAVDFERYKRSIARIFRRETPFKMQFAGACCVSRSAQLLTRECSRWWRCQADSGDGTTAYGGTIIDAKPVRQDGLVPWEWLRVEWDDGGEDMTQVNPW